jgi:hypothetical protein
MQPSYYLSLNMLGTKLGFENPEPYQEDRNPEPQTKPKQTLIQP